MSDPEKYPDDQWRDVRHHKESHVPNLDDPNDPHYQFSASGDVLMRDLQPKGPETGDLDQQATQLASKSHTASQKGKSRRDRSETPPRHHASSHHKRHRHTASRYRTRSPRHKHRHHKRPSHRRQRSRSSSRSGSHSGSARSSRSSSRSSLQRSSRSSSYSHSKSRSPSPIRPSTGSRQWVDKAPKEHVASTWISEPGKHGQRRKVVNAKGKSVPHRTTIEALQTRDKKCAYVEAHGHYFGRLHHFRYNPYSTNKSLIKKSNRKIFPRPFSQAGRGSNSLQDALGLKDDRDIFNDVRGSCREHCARLGISQRSEARNWQAVPAEARSRLLTLMLNDYPFLSHFCDEDGDSWAVKMIAQSFLVGRKSQQRKREGTVSGKHVRQHTHTQGEAAPKAQSEEDQPSEAEEDDRDRTNDDPPPEQSRAPRLALSGQDAADRRKAARVQAHEVEREKRLKDAEDAAKKAAKAPKGSTGGKKSRKGKSQAEGDAMLDNDTGGAQRPPEDVAGPSSRPDGARQEPQATKAKVGRPRKTANDPEKPGSTSSTKRNKNMAEPNKPVTRSGATVPVRHITAAPE